MFCQINWTYLERGNGGITELNVSFTKIALNVGLRIDSGVLK